MDLFGPTIAFKLMANISISQNGTSVLEINLDQHQNIGILISIVKDHDEQAKWLDLYASAFNPGTLTHTKWDVVRLNWPTDVRVCQSSAEADPGYSFDPNELIG